MRGGRPTELDGIVGLVNLSVDPKCSTVRRYLQRFEKTRREYPLPFSSTGIDIARRMGTARSRDIIGHTMVLGTLGFRTSNAMNNMALAYYS